MPKEYFSKSSKKYFLRENVTQTGSGTTVPQSDQIAESLDKYREIKTRRVTRKYGARKN